MDFELYKGRLFEILLGESLYDDFMILINELHRQGFRKKEICSLFLEFQKDIQIDPRTKDDDRLFDILSDFMDGFDNTKEFRILPDETIR